VKTELRHLFEPIELGGVRIKNRIVNTANSHELPYIEALAKGGVGLFVLSGPSEGVAQYTGSPYHYVPGAAGEIALQPNPATPQGRAFFDARVTPMLRALAEVVHRHDAVCFGQIHNLGNARLVDNMTSKVAPSSMPSEGERSVPHELTVVEIAELVDAFGQSARRVKEAGMDGVEIHAAHGYLVNQFLSPYTNRRNDSYGGSLDNRMRFLLEIFEAVRGVIGPDAPLGVRLNGDEFVEGGLTSADMQEIARRIEDRVAYISVSSGDDTGMRKGVKVPYVAPWLVPAGNNIPLAAAIKSAVKLPIIVGGRMNDPMLAEQALADGHADMVGMVRALFADPELPQKALEGRLEDIRPCVGMNECHNNRGFAARSCVVNAAYGREQEMEIIPAKEPKRVVILGAGPAGMETARVAALRGHQVVLVEREDRLGGRPAFLARDTTRPELRRWLDYLERQVEKAGVDVRLGVDATVETVEALSPDAVVLAIGADDFAPDVDGIGSSHVVTGTDVFRGTAKVGQTVVVVGGLNDQLPPMTVSDFLARQGKNVEIISELLMVGQNLDPRVLNLLTKRLLDEGVKLTTITELTGVGNRYLDVVNRFTREPGRIDGVDTVVLAAGTRARTGLVDALRGRVKELHVVGDCSAPRRIVHATLDGARVSRIL
jgi:2,4-dienoyl-CoA reductase-like NADH-dependent reductase (Old Yellow Enzyme family)/thioredoxin reductase